MLVIENESDSQKNQVDKLEYLDVKKGLTLVLLFLGYKDVDSSNCNLFCF